MTLIYFLLILGVTVFFHELGHFIFAKRAGIYVYEFSIGMGPKLYSFKRSNDETVYSIRAIPLGGFVQMAGEEVDDDKNIPPHQKMQAKTWGERFITIVAGALFNFLLALGLLFIIGLFYGAPETRPVMGKIEEGYPTFLKGIEEGDLVLSIEDKKVKSWDDVLLYLALTKEGKTLTFKFQKKDGYIEKVSLTPILKEENGESSYKYGLVMTDKINRGFISAVKFSIVKFGAVMNSMVQVLKSLITGGLGLENLAGPVGIYSIVEQEVSHGFGNVFYLIAFLSINVGFINLLPFPAFDGGRVLFLIIEKIKGTKVDPKIENIIHGIGFALLILLMIVITYQDIKKLFM
ncbi:MAG: RIP metalloprotease RseP [Bacilli bacterium]|jgi:regulator of sigma E protease